RRAVRRFADQPRNLAGGAAHRGGAYGAARDRRRGRADLFRRLPGGGGRLHRLPAEFRDLAAGAARRCARMSMSAIPVSRIAAAWVAAVIILLICTIALAVLGGGGSPATVMASTYSRSAIGYAGIADMMHRLGARVIKSRKDSVAQLDPAGVLIVAEPAQSVP